MNTNIKDWIKTRTADKRPHPNDLKELVEHAKTCIAPDSLAHEEDDRPGILLTIGWNPVNGEWGWQTGDNSFTGAAYHYPIWAVVEIYPNSDTHEVVKQIREQLEELQPIRLEDY